MGYEPVTYCAECNEPFDVYRAPEDRICESCQELQPKGTPLMTFAELPVGTPFKYASLNMSNKYVKVSEHYATTKGRKTPTMIRSDAEVIVVLK